MATRPKLP